MNYKYKLSVIFILFLVFVLTPLEVKAAGMSIGPATYTNGTVTEIIQINCGDFTQLGLGGTLTFVVYADGDLADDLRLYAVSLPPGATFPTVTGIVSIHSTFTWTPPGPFDGVITIVAEVGPLVTCNLNFDWVLPVELASFTSVVNGNNVDLKWQTVTETNNSGFEIQRSKLLDGNQQEWIAAGMITGNGSTKTPFDYSFTDRGLDPGNYKYRLKQIDYNGNSEFYYLTDNVQIGIPQGFMLSQNYPNPFNPLSHLEFAIPELGFVSLKVYDALGNEVKTLVNENKTAGVYSVEFDGSDLSSGVYYYRLTAGEFTEVKKMTLLK